MVSFQCSQTFDLVIHDGSRGLHWFQYEAGSSPNIMVLPDRDSTKRPEMSISTPAAHSCTMDQTEHSIYFREFAWCQPRSRHSYLHAHQSVANTLPCADAQVHVDANTYEPASVFTGRTRVLEASPGKGCRTFPAIK